MTQQVVDLSAHINQTVERGHAADFPVTLRPVFFEENGARREVPRRFAVIREDSDAPLGVVSDRYALVPHQRILDTVEEALKPLDPAASTSTAAVSRVSLKSPHSGR